MISTVIGGAMPPHAPQFFTMPETEDKAVVAHAQLRTTSLLLSLSLLLGACGHNPPTDPESSINVYPANYKSEILAGMHAYVKNPTGIRDAVISEPALKSTGSVTLYIACLRYNPKKNATEYSGTKEIAAIFISGRLDRFVDIPKDECAGASYAAFPELQKLPP
jgi:hypothetical protein